MTAFLVVGSAMLGLSGLLVVAGVLVGVLPSSQARPAPSTGLWTRAVDGGRKVPRKTWVTVAVGMVLGCVLAQVLAWPVLVLAVPAVIIGLPRLLSEPPQPEVQLLEALDRWIRGMMAQLSTGKSITDALRLSGRQAPPLLAPRLATLVQRLDDRWSASQALMAMADELDNAAADSVLAALILSAARGGTGASVTLSALADSLQDRLRALREIEAERAKPRVVVRQVVVITLLALVGFMVWSPAFFEPYSTPAGQVILLSLLTAYVGSIMVMRRMTVPRRRERILRPLS